MGIDLDLYVERRTPTGWESLNHWKPDGRFRDLIVLDYEKHDWPTGHRYNVIWQLFAGQFSFLPLDGLIRPPQVGEIDSGEIAKYFLDGCSPEVARAVWCKWFSYCTVQDLQNYLWDMPYRAEDSDEPEKPLKEHCPVFYQECLPKLIALGDPENIRVIAVFC